MGFTTLMETAVLKGCTMPSTPNAACCRARRTMWHSLVVRRIHGDAPTSPKVSSLPTFTVPTGFQQTRVLAYSGHNDFNCHDNPRMEADHAETSRTFRDARGAPPGRFGAQGGMDGRTLVERGQARFANRMEDSLLRRRRLRTNEANRPGSVEPTARKTSGKENVRFRPAGAAQSQLVQTDQDFASKPLGLIATRGISGVLS